VAAAATELADADTSQFATLYEHARGDGTTRERHD